MPRVEVSARVDDTLTAGTVLNCSQLDPGITLPAFVVPSTVVLYCNEGSSVGVGWGVGGERGGELLQPLWCISVGCLSARRLTGPLAGALT